MERRLAAILAADVANYSLLMNTDEGATYTAWRSARVDVVDPRIAEFNGRIVKHTGDGFLAEFPTVLAAVECAVGMQNKMAERDVRIVGDRPFQFRIGINLGDIIVDDEDIHGDGVNIAARLESIAEAGGICVSADVFRQVSNKPGFQFIDLGDRSVKNIRAPIRVYSVSSGEAGIVSPPPAVIETTPAKVNPNLDAVLDAISTPAHVGTSLMVGRESEHATLTEAFAEAEIQQGNITLIRGEPGIGKSYLAWSFSEKVRATGARVVFGQCHETLGSPPFWPWLQVLKALYASGNTATVPSATIFESMTAAAPTMENNAPSTFASNVGNAGSEQFLLFNRIANLLAETASGQTLLIVLDDLHWADRSSLLLLTHLCRKLAAHPIMIVGTYREMEVTRKHPLFKSLGEIGREAKLRRIGLKGLSPQDVSGFLAKSVEQTLPQALVNELYEKTEGNPLFVSEVANILQQEKHLLCGRQLALEIPDGIQEAIGRRLNLLSDACNEMLLLASVIGRHFSLRVLNPLMPEVNQLELLNTLEEATNRGILNDSNTAAGEFQFSHVLIRDILYGELSLAKKICLHSKVADTLVDLEAKGAQQSPGEIARHYYQALQSGRGDQALDFAVRAAEHAYNLSAFDESHGYYELALDIISIDEGDHDVLKVQSLLNMVKCHHAIGRPNPEVIASLNHCLKESRKIKHYATFVDAACRKAYQVRAGIDVEEALNDIDEALGYVPATDLNGRANVLAFRAMALTFNNRRREAEEVAYSAIDVASQSGDWHAHVNALCTALLVLRGRPEKLSERIQLGEKALQVAQASTDDFVSMDPLEWLILSYQELGDFNRSRQLVAILSSSVKETYRFKPHYFSVGASACLALFAGQWALSEGLIEDAVELGSDSLDGGAEGVYGAQMFLMNRELGRLPMIYTALQHLVSDHTPMWKPGLLATYTDLDLLSDAKPLYETLTTDEFGAVAEDELQLTCLVYLSETCMALNDASKAAGLFHRLLPYSGQMISHPTAVCYGPADMYLGMLSSVMNNLDEAEKFFVSATTLSTKAGQNMWHAHIKYRHAQVLHRYNYSGGKAVFSKLVDEARTAALSLGMINIQKKIEQLESNSSIDQVAHLNGLTPRELEVLNLITQGKSNKLIAAELNRSLATVATHVRAILHKTHTANRTEAAAFARVNEL